MTPSRRRELERRIVADRKRRPEPAPFTRVVRGTAEPHTAAPAPVYTSCEDGPGAKPRVLRK